MARSKEVSRSEGRGSAALWFGVLAGPAAWSVQVLVGYNAEEIACSAGSRTEDLGGFGIETVIIATSIALTLVTLLGLVVSIWCLRSHAGSDETTGGRARWMGIAGVMTSVLFLIVLATGFAPIWFLSTCTPPL